jgi:hypothetical protein
MILSVQRPLQQALYLRGVEDLTSTSDLANRFSS